MISITKKRFKKTIEHMKGSWSFEEHIREIYDPLRVRRRRFPSPAEEASQTPLVQKKLVAWNADLGKRDQMNWSLFHERHRDILEKLFGLRHLGKLRRKDYDLVCQVLMELEDFKPSKGRSLVFASKSAHFYFPGLIPCTSREVREGLKALEKKKGEDLHALVPDGGRTLFSFTTAENNLRSYRNYLALGNALCANLDPKDFLGKKTPSFDLHAKIYEWWVISYSL